MTDIKPTISYDDFAKIDIRVVEVVSADFIEGSDKLLKLEVLLKNEKRQILSGIRAWYEPSQLIGKKLLVVANLQPRKMMGMESQGMILAIDSTKLDKPILLEFGEEVDSGDIVR